MSDHIELFGEVVQVSRDKFIVEVFNEHSEKVGTTITAQLSGKMRMNKIRVILGDRVGVKVSPYDLKHGFIVSRNR